MLQIMANFAMILPQEISVLSDPPSELVLLLEDLARRVEA